MSWIDGTVISMFMYIGGFAVAYLHHKRRYRVSIKQLTPNEWYVTIDGKQASYMMSYDHACNTSDMMDEALNATIKEQARTKR